MKKNDVSQKSAHDGDDSSEKIIRAVMWSVFGFVCAVLLTGYFFMTDNPSSKRYFDTSMDVILEDII